MKCCVLVCLVGEVIVVLKCFGCVYFVEEVVMYCLVIGVDVVG